MPVEEWLPAHPEFWIPLVIVLWSVWGVLKLRDLRRSNKEEQ